MSRNRTFGKNILKHNLNERKNLLAEGVNTLSALRYSCQIRFKKLPILSFLLQLKDNNFKIKHFDPRKLLLSFYENFSINFSLFTFFSIKTIGQVEGHFYSHTQFCKIEKKLLYKKINTTFKPLIFNDIDSTIFCTMKIMMH